MLTLMYHNVLTRSADHVPVAEGQVTIETFSKHVMRLGKKLLHPLDVHEQLLRGKVPNGVLITFDDGAAGILDAGKVLASIGAVGAAFICPGALSSGLWFYRLADALARAEVSRITWQANDFCLTHPLDRLNAYKTISTQLFDLSATIRDDCLGELVKGLRLPSGESSPALTTLDQSTVRHAADTGGLIFANHSWSHPNLVKLSPAQLEREVIDAQLWLQSSGLPIVPWFAFPRGEYNASVVELVTKCNLVAFGATPTELDARVLPRTYIWEGDSRRIRFLAKIAWEGRLRRFFWR